MTPTRVKSLADRRPGGAPPAGPAVPRRAITLIELLIAIAIVSILAALLVGVAAAATRTAREARSKQMISRLHTLVMERYDSYRSRRVELSDDALSLLPAAFNDMYGSFAPLTGMRSGVRSAWVRLLAAREQQKLEMPDRWSDVLLGNVPTPPAQVDFATLGAGPLRTRYVDQRSTLSLLYLREYNRVVEHLGTLGLSPTEQRERLLTNQAAECLYLMVINGTGDGESRGLFNDKDIGDTDEDSAPEFLDGWGEPIGLLRWAPGYESDTQLSFERLKSIYRRALRDGSASEAEVATRAAINEDRDPLDVFRLDGPDAPGAFNVSGSGADVVVSARGWRLAPLVYSGGGDRQAGIRTRDNDPSAPYRINPYLRDIDPGQPGDQRLGEVVDDEAASDDITNQQAGSLGRAA